MGVGNRDGTKSAVPVDRYGYRHYGQSPWRGHPFQALVEVGGQLKHKQFIKPADPNEMTIHQQGNAQLAGACQPNVS